MDKDYKQEKLKRSMIISRYDLQKAKDENFKERQDIQTYDRSTKMKLGS